MGFTFKDAGLHTGSGRERCDGKVKIWTWRQAIEKSRMSTGAKCLCYTLSNHLSDCGRYHVMPVEEIAEAINAGMRSAERYLAEAATAEFIEITKQFNPGTGYRTASLYRPKFPSWATLDDEAAKVQEEPTKNDGQTAKSAGRTRKEEKPQTANMAGREGGQTAKSDKSHVDFGGAREASNSELPIEDELPESESSLRSDSGASAQTKTAEANSETDERHQTNPSQDAPKPRWGFPDADEAIQAAKAKKAGGDSKRASTVNKAGDNGAGSSFPGDLPGAVPPSASPKEGRARERQKTAAKLKAKGADQAIDAEFEEVAAKPHQKPDIGSGLAEAERVENQEPGTNVAVRASVAVSGTRAGATKFDFKALPETYQRFWSAIQKAFRKMDCVSAWNKNPVGGVIGVQTGPL
jgi:hypothetical protein